MKSCGMPVPVGLARGSFRGMPGGGAEKKFRVKLSV